MDVQGGAGRKIVEATYKVFASINPAADGKPRPLILYLQLMSS